MPVALPTPQMRSDGYGHARMPRGASAPEPDRIERVQYGRFRNVYLYITEACQLGCVHLASRLSDSMVSGLAGQAKVVEII
jgi:hypothetical protein